jgi:2-aminoadipate transaminase
MDRMDLSQLELDRSSVTPLFRQLVDVLCGAITDGGLALGERLPSERDLAAQLGMSRTTVVSAYRELEARGLVRGHVGRGTFVCAPPEHDGAPFAWRGKVALAAQRTTEPALRTLVRSAADPGAISFAAGAPALDLFPMDAVRAITDAVLSRGATAALGLSPVEGQPAFRRAVAARFGVRPEQVLALSGAQQGLDLIARCLLDPGDTVVIDRPGYLGAIQTFRAAGARLVGWDIGRADFEELEDLLLRYRPKFLYTVPTFQNPTGRTLPVHARRDLLALAARYRLPVIEDEPYRDLYFDRAPPPALAHLDEHGLVIHVGTFSKTLASGLRLGWLMAPAAIVDQLALIKQHTDVGSSNLSQLVVAEMLTSKLYDAHIGPLRVEHARRHRVMLEALARWLPVSALRCQAVEGGLYLWCTLGQGLDARRVAEAAADAGVVVARGNLFYADGAGTSELRLCFTSVPPPLIEEGVRRLGRLLHDAAGLRQPADAELVPLV